jgi:hypothetical protein
MMGEVGYRAALDRTAQVYRFVRYVRRAEAASLSSRFSLEDPSEHQARNLFLALFVLSTVTPAGAESTVPAVIRNGRIAAIGGIG